MPVMASALPLDTLRSAFGERLRQHQPVARYTSARIGGDAGALIEVHSADELAATAQSLWDLDVAFVVLGGGSNVLVSDAGIHSQVVVLNQANQVRFEAQGVWAESGAGLGVIARQAAGKNLGGLEWAAGIPGTIGGAVVGNAGAHGGDVSMVLELAEILHQEKGRQQWAPQELAYGYRSSWFKHNPGQAVVLSARLRLADKPEDEIRAQMETFQAYRRLTQPPGASMGSMFKNPAGESAGRLIEQAGLKGTQIGKAQISPLHGNFFLNLGDARAADVYALIDKARRTVKEMAGIELQLEIELIGDWE